MKKNMKYLKRGMPNIVILYVYFVHGFWQLIATVLFQTPI